jgi:hypothetical protein
LVTGVAVLELVIAAAPSPGEIHTVLSVRLVVVE